MTLFISTDLNCAAGSDNRTLHLIFACVWIPLRKNISFFSIVCRQFFDILCWFFVFLRANCSYNYSSYLGFWGWSWKVSILNERLEGSDARRLGGKKAWKLGCKGAHSTRPKADSSPAKFAALQFCELFNPVPSTGATGQAWQVPVKSATLHIFDILSGIKGNNQKLQNFAFYTGCNLLQRLWWACDSRVQTPGLCHLPGASGQVLIEHSILLSGAPT